MKISNPKRATQILILILKIMEKRRRKAKVVEEAEVAEEAEEVVAKVENKRRLDKTGEHTKLEVKKKSNIRKSGLIPMLKKNLLKLKAHLTCPAEHFQIE